MKDQDGHGRDAAPELRERDLERRVAELEQQVVTIAAAVDAASRMQVATAHRLHQDIRIAGGRLVRRILEKGRLGLRRLTAHRIAPATPRVRRPRGVVGPNRLQALWLTLGGAEEMRPVRRGTHGGMLTRRTGGLDARPSSPYVCELGAAQYLTLGGH